MLGPLMLDLQGKSLLKEEYDLLQNKNVGGIIFFARNFESPTQIASLIKEIRAINPDLLLAVDQEGGTVQRFQTGFTKLPALQSMGELYDHDPAAAKTKAFAAGYVMAAELLQVGIDFSFAPVIDLNRGVSRVIGTRSFHRDPTVISILAAQFQAGMQKAGMQAVAKHFPGHGSVALDTHTDLVTDTRSEAELQDDLYPFKQLIQNQVAAIMPAHIVYSALDPLPASLSPYWLKTVLRDELQFQGAIFSDDLQMAGAQVFGSMMQRCEQALNAGCDMILICNQPTVAREIATNMEVGLDAVSSKRLMAMHAKPANDLQQLKIFQHQLHEEALKP